MYSMCKRFNHLKNELEPLQVATLKRSNKPIKLDICRNVFFLKIENRKINIANDTTNYCVFLNKENQCTQKLICARRGKRKVNTTRLTMYHSSVNTKM